VVVTKSMKTGIGQSYAIKKLFPYTLLYKSQVKSMRFPTKKHYCRRGVTLVPNHPDRQLPRARARERSAGDVVNSRQKSGYRKGTWY